MSSASVGMASGWGVRLDQRPCCLLPVRPGPLRRRPCRPYCGRTGARPDVLQERREFGRAASCSYPPVVTTTPGAEACRWMRRAGRGCTAARAANKDASWPGLRAKVSGLRGGAGSAGAPSGAKILWKRLLRRLSSLPLAMAQLSAIAALSAVGTVIEQNQSFEYYVANYPDGPRKVVGFVDWHLIYALQWDHIYTAGYFLALLALLGAQLAACTATRQWPAVRVARRWRFAETPARVVVLAGDAGAAAALPDARAGDLACALAARGYQVFLSAGRLYAFKGLAGKLGPIAVHASLLAIMAGVSYGGLCGLKGSVMVPEGGDFVLSQQLRPLSPLAHAPAAADAAVHVHSFDVVYRDDGSVEQFTSDLAVGGGTGSAARKIISVNDPLRFHGVTLYQADYSMAALTVRAPGSPLQPPGGEPFNLPMASLEGQPGVKGKLWATFLPTEPGGAATQPPRGVSILARDFQTVALYDAKGAFVGVRRPGSGKALAIDGVPVEVLDIVGATGLELKADPGVPYVYAGFAGLMLATMASYLSHSQVWALQAGADLHVAGRTNRAKLAFAREFEDLLNMVPDRALPCPTRPDDGDAALGATRGVGSEDGALSEM